jgi:hypothetical protein
MKSNELIPVLIKAIQELADKNMKLAEYVGGQQKEIEELKRLLQKH